MYQIGLGELAIQVSYNLFHKQFLRDHSGTPAT
jgi:hypothetical protein